MIVRRFLFTFALLCALVLSCKPRTAGNDAYIWYPGQLASYLQEQQRQKSAERCMNIGYPGKFFAPQAEVTFRAPLSSSEAAALQYSATGTVTRWQDDAYSFFKVVTDGSRLPALFPKGRDGLRSQRRPHHN